MFPLNALWVQFIWLNQIDGVQLLGSSFKVFSCIAQELCM